MKKIELPDVERGRSEWDLKRLDTLNARLAQPYKPRRGRTAEQQRESDLAARAELESRDGGRSKTRRIREAVAETIALAEARGEKVTEFRAGVSRILSRDPLWSLFLRGHLVVAQFNTGIEIRGLYAKRTEDLSTPEPTGLPSAKHDNGRFVAQRARRAVSTERIGRIELAVAGQCKDEPACLTMLRAICERDLSLSSQGEGRAFQRNARAFARALDVAADVPRVRGT